MIDRVEAGRRLKAARESAGLTQVEAAARLVMSRQQLWQIEAGRRVPAWPVLVEIVINLGLDPEQVIPEFFGIELPTVTVPTVKTKQAEEPDDDAAIQKAIAVIRAEKQKRRRR